MIELDILSYPTPLIGAWFFLLGTVIGSFLNVVVLRHEAEKGLSGRSACPHCNKQLTWRELIPVLSYLAQRGKCVGCGARISPQYPLVEFATGILFSVVFIHIIGPSYTAYQYPVFIDWLRLGVDLSIWSVLVVITVYDLRTKLIPDVFSYTFSGLALIPLALSSLTSLPPTALSLLAGPILFLPFYLLWKVSNGRWIGLGDGKLALGIGWFLGLEHGGSAILLSFWIGAGVSLLLIAFQHGIALFRRHYSLQPTSHALCMKSEIPFGPFMVFATLCVYLTGFSIVTLVW